MPWLISLRVNLGPCDILSSDRRIFISIFGGSLDYCLGYDSQPAKWNWALTNFWMGKRIRRATAVVAAYNGIALHSAVRAPCRAWWS